MSYYLRAFCTAGEPPAVDPVVAYAATRSSRLRVVEGADHGSWPAALEYKAGKSPLYVDVTRPREGGLFEEEIAEFLEAIAPLKGAGRRTVERHLRQVTFIVAVQLDTGDVDDDGYEAVGDVLWYFIDHNGALIQADGEGFYEGLNVTLPLK